MYDDNAIMQGTQILNAEKPGLITVLFTLPSGLKIDSGAMAADSLKGKVLTDWCNHVRQVATNEEARIEEENEAKRKARKANAEPAKVEDTEEPLKRPVNHSDPEDYVQSRLTWAKQEVDRLTEQKLVTDAALSRAHQDLDKWRKVADSIGENHVET